MPGQRHSRGLAAAAFLCGLLVVVPFFWTGVPVGEDDPIALGLGTGLKARWERNVTSLYTDDAFYYLRIAQHLADGAGSTFDGVHPTNGYHPLWLLTLVPLAGLTPGNLLLAGFVIQVLAAALTTALIARLASLVVGTPTATGTVGAIVAVAVWLRIQCSYWMSWSGMEYGLQALAVVGLLNVYLGQMRRERPPQRLDVLGLGVLAGITVLARLDNVMLVALIGLAVAGRHVAGRHVAGRRVDGRWSSLVLYATPIVLVMAVYVGVNLWLFEQPWPISGEVKRAWSQDLLAVDPNLERYGWLGAKAIYLVSPLWSLSRSFALSLLVGAFGGMALALPRICAPNEEPPRAFDLWPLALFSLLQVLAYGVTFHGGFSFQPRYFVAQPLVTALLAAMAVDRFSVWVQEKPGLRLAKPWVIGSLLVVILASGAINTARRQERQLRYGAEPLFVAAGWAARNLPVDATVGAWNAGILGFFSQRRVVNLDGLVNSRTFFLEGRQDLCVYLEREGINTLVDVFDAARPFAQYEKALGPCVSRLELIWEGPTYPGSSPLRRALAFRWLPAKD